MEFIYEDVEGVLLGLKKKLFNAIILAYYTTLMPLCIAVIHGVHGISRGCS